MLNSEAKGWRYYISWDNPIPSDSSSMLKDLSSLGKVSQLQTKTSVALSPKPRVTWRDVRKVIKNNLHPKKGNAFYVNLKSSKAFQIGTKTKMLWKHAK